MRALGGLPVQSGVGMWMPASATPWHECMLLRFVGISRPLLKFGGGSIEILHDVLH